MRMTHCARRLALLRVAAGAALLLAPGALRAQPAEPGAQSGGEDDAVALSLPGPDEVQILVLEGGSELVGRIEEIGAEEVRFRSGELEVTVPIAEIRELRVAPASSIHGGEYWFPNPNQSRLFFAPTARPLPKGGGYVADHLFFFPSVTYGVTDNFTFGAGMSLFPGTSIDEQVGFLTPKFGWSVNDRLHVGVGAIFAVLPGDEDADSAGIAFSVATYGTPDASVTAGIGYGYADDELADKPMLMLGGERRITRRLALVSENWIFPGVTNPLVSGGVRFLGERMSADLALVYAVGQDGGFLPLLNFVFRFGAR